MILAALVPFSDCLDPGAVEEATLGQPRIFSVRRMKVRQGINPKTKEPITFLRTETCLWYGAEVTLFWGKGGAQTLFGLVRGSAQPKRSIILDLTGSLRRFGVANV